MMEFILGFFGEIIEVLKAIFSVLDTVFIGIIGGGIGAFATISVANKNIEMENITQERRNWREKIRDKASEVVTAYQAKDKNKLTKLYVDFQVRLNPYDNNDIEILDTLRKMKEDIAKKDIYTDINEDLIDELSKKLALLLKHDWERAKIEVKPFYCFTKYCKSLCLERISCDEYEKRGDKDDAWLCWFSRILKRIKCCVCIKCNPEKSSEQKKSSMTDNNGDTQG